MPPHVLGHDKIPPDIFCQVRAVRAKAQPDANAVLTRHPLCLTPLSPIRLYFYLPRKTHYPARNLLEPDACGRRRLANNVTLGTVQVIDT